MHRISLVLTLLLFTCLGSRAQTGDSATIFVMMMKPGTPVSDYRMLDPIEHQLDADEKVLYDPQTHTAFAANGYYGFMDEKVLQRLDTTYFKFTYAKSKTKVSKGDALYDTATAQHLAINTILFKAGMGNKKSLEELLDLVLKVNGEAADELASMIWITVNTWSDKNLEEFLKGLSAEKRALAAEYLTDESNTYPIEFPVAYLQLYYPRSLAVIKTAAK
jgi:regulation of enolase protein 1 (concanavalin A-like superfamily)